MAGTDLENQSPLKAQPAPAKPAGAEEGPAPAAPEASPGGQAETGPAAGSEAAGGEPAAAGGPAQGGVPKSFYRRWLAFWSQVAAWRRELPNLADIYVWLLSLFGFRLKPEKLLRYAHSLAIREKWPEAIAAFNQVIALRPLNIMARNSLGQVYHHLGRTEQAETELAIAASLEILIVDRNNLEAAAKLARALVKKGRPREAVSLVEPILAAHLFSPGNFELLKAMAEVYQLTHHKKKEAQVYQAGLAQYPKEADFYLLQGEMALKDSNILEGERLLTVGRILSRLSVNPNDVGALTSLGELYVSENRLKDGLPLLARAAGLEPHNIGLRWRLFNLHQKSQEAEEALKYLLEIVALRPDDEEIQYRLADFYRKNQGLEQALAIYRDLAKAHPFDPRPHEALGATMTEAGEFEKGQEYLELAKILGYGLKPRPNHRESVAFMKFLFNSGHNKQGWEWLEKALLKWPYSGELLLTKIKILYARGHYQEAVSLIKRLLSVKNDSAEAHMWLALCHQRKGNNLAAVSEAQLAARLAPKSFTVHQVLGDILKEQKKLSPANAAYEAASMLRKSAAKSAAP